MDREEGLFIGAHRNAEDDQYYWRITQFLMPSFTMVPPRCDYPVHGHFWIPINDDTCYAWSYDYKPERDLTDQEIWHMEQGKGVHCEYVLGTYIPKANKDNDYLMNRNDQRMGISYSGMEDIVIQDGSLQESMVGVDPVSGRRVAWGGTCDRTQEVLAPTDKGIMKARRMMFDAIEKLQEKDQTPPGVEPESHKVRSASVLLKRDVNFEEDERTLEALKEIPGTGHAPV